MIKGIKIKYGDYLINILSFSIYIGIQQLVLLPLLSNKLTQISFSNTILFLTVFNILSIAMGNELGNVYILKEKSDFKVDIVYIKILLQNTFILLIISFLFSMLLKNSLLLLFLTFLFSNIKNFSTGILRKNDKYKELMIGNIYYSLGVIMGLFTLFVNNNFLYPFLFGELISLLYLIYILKKNNIKIIDEGPSNVKMEFNSLFFVSLLLNGLSYLDRFLIYPILGAVAMNAYYSTSAMSKFLSLLVNPINNVMMTKLSNSEKKINYGQFIKIMSWVLIISILLSMFTSFLGLYILYRKYLYVSLKLIVPVGIGSGLTITILLIKSFFMINNGTKELIKINLHYALVFIISALIGSHLFGLVGFAWSNVFSRFVQLIVYCYSYEKGRY
ncbi:MAG: lipopolysaccharide biosynthesis protein [Vagococcus sp.]